MNKELIILILAAGLGKRMHSDIPKVLHRILDKPILYYVIETARNLCPEKVITIIGYKADLIQQEFMHYDDIAFVLQEKMLGTGHAVMQTENFLRDYAGKLLILCGDTPLLTKETLSEFIEKANESPFNLLSFKLENPEGYGRIIRNNKDEFIGIVEEKDAKDYEKSIREVNSGIYLVESNLLFSLLKDLDNNNAQSEFYLTDTVSIYFRKGGRPFAFISNDPLQFIGINTPEQLKKAEEIMRTRN
ncbi:MAG: NTP transferase domain-containing protein [Candidatus Coatesbacteria bacterium]|nr:NTP transferase domain-containing protein [Candidatus Coatesbacteria bacterium]